MINKNIAGDLIHRQDMPRHDLAEYLRYRQNLEKFGTPLGRFEKPDGIFEALTKDKRLVIWQLINDISLLKVSGYVNVQFVSEQIPRDKA